MTTPNHVPPGMWFEQDRQRWRVRIHRRHVVVHESYHAADKYDEAYSSWLEGKRRQRAVRNSELQKHDTMEQKLALLAEGTLI